MQLARHRRKIDPSARIAEGASDVSTIGPANPAIAEWQAAGLRAPDLGIIRAYRLERLRAELRKRDLAGALLCDPLNIRYATDVSNMQVWCLHNATRYCFIATDGPVVLFDYASAMHLSNGYPLIDEVRPATAFFYMYTGADEERHAKRWANEIADLVTAHGAGNVRLAVDKCEPLGIDLLRRLGIDPIASQAFCEEARKIKHAEEIVAMRRAMHACETGIAAMWHYLRPGLTENQVWAKLHEANIARGGEWIETRLLASGPRTNPWFSECSDRVIEAGDIVAFDTDLIGPYGICCDISRTWIAGAKPDVRQQGLLDLATAQIEHNMALLKPGVTFYEFIERSFQLPADCIDRRYGVAMHGVGLCDEYPSIYYREDAHLANDGVFEPGMVMCVESLISPKDGPESVKLETQVLITEKGIERLDNFPFVLTPTLI